MVEPFRLPAEVAQALRAELGRVSEDTVSAIVAEVPDYSRAFAGPMGETIRAAVQVALGAFLDSLARSRRRDDTPAHAGAYDLGRGEARSGRSADALLAAYRVGARVAWRELAGAAVVHGLEADQLVVFADQVFAYIDELSAASVAGHTDETETTGRLLQRMRERLARLLMMGAAPDVASSAAERADWEPPKTLVAVLARPADVRRVRTQLGTAASRVLVAGDDQLAQIPELAHLGQPGAGQRAVLLVPDLQAATIARRLSNRAVLVGSQRPWLEAAESVRRVVRAHALGIDGRHAINTADHLAALVRQADPAALTELRARALAPLDAVGESTRGKLEETLRMWLLLQGRRDQVAEALFVHPQTVRYRMGRVRELFGDRLNEPAAVRDLVIALG